MSTVLGIDLSSHAVDLVTLDETTNQAHHQHIPLPGKHAWDRTLTIPTLMPAGSWWDTIYLIAIEAPYGRGQAGTQALLNRVVGAIVASIPHRLRVPERCWIVRPDEWKTGLKLKGKPSRDDVDGLGFDCDGWEQDARDALCLAYWARQTNRRGIEAA